MFCSSCGNECDSNDMICKSCGSMLTPEDEIIVREEDIFDNDIDMTDDSTQMSNDKIDSLLEKFSDSDSDFVKSNEAIFQEDKQRKGYIDNKALASNEKKKFLSYTGIVAAFIMLVAFINVFVLSLIITESVKPEKLRQTFNEMDVLDLKMGGIVSSDEFEIKKNDSLKEIIYKAINNCTDVTVEEKDIAAIYDVTELDKYFADRCSQYVNYVFGGDAPKEIDADEIFYYINNHKADIEKIVKRPINDQQLQTVNNFLKNYNMLDVMTVVNIDNELEEKGLEEYDQFFEPWVRTSLVVLSLLLVAVLILVIYKLNRNNNKSLGVIGSACIVAAIPLISAGLVAVFAKSFIRDKFNQIGDIVSDVASILGLRMLLLSSILFGVGVIISVISYVLCKRNKTLIENN